MPRLAASLEREQGICQFASRLNYKISTQRQAMPWYYGTALCNSISDKTTSTQTGYDTPVIICLIKEHGLFLPSSSNGKIIAFPPRLASGGSVVSHSVSFWVKLLWERRYLTPRQDELEKSMLQLLFDKPGDIARRTSSLTHIFCAVTGCDCQHRFIRKQIGQQK